MDLGRLTFWRAPYGEWQFSDIDPRQCGGRFKIGPTESGKRMGDALKIVTLCTGNVARSVMLGYMLETLNEVSGLNWSVRTAGTHVVEGLAMSARTRDALQRIDELGAHHYNAHRSHQLLHEDVAWADVILASEADHVRYVRANFPDHAAKAVQLYQFVRHAPLDAAFDEQLAIR